MGSRRICPTRKKLDNCRTWFHPAADCTRRVDASSARLKVPCFARNWCSEFKKSTVKNMKLHQFKAILLIAALSSFSHLAFAAPQKVDKAVANFTTHTLTITGSNFLSPTVTLDNINLTVTSSSATSIVATLPTD